MGGATFASVVDSSWSTNTRAGEAGFETLELRSTQAPLDSQGIPRAGAIGITVSESPASVIAGLTPEASITDPQARASAAIALLSAVVRTPTGAQGVAMTQPPRYRALAGASAAEASYEYSYGGRGNIQFDLVARRRGKIYFVELDTDLARMTQGEAAFTQLLARWRWR